MPPPERQSELCPPPANAVADKATQAQHQPALHQAFDHSAVTTERGRSSAAQVTADDFTAAGGSTSLAKAYIDSLNRFSFDSRKGRQRVDQRKPWQT
jgi:hypothetical protein